MVPPDTPTVALCKTGGVMSAVDEFVIVLVGIAAASSPVGA